MEENYEYLLFHRTPGCSGQLTPRSVCRSGEAYHRAWVDQFVVGAYGKFDSLAAQAVRRVKKQHPDILLFYLRPYHPAEGPFTPAGFDGSFYPPGMETVPRKLAIVRANRYMVDNSQFLIAYARYSASNAWELTEYTLKREKKGLIHVENLAQSTNFPPQIASDTLDPKPQ